jgi:hypothetical protein
MIMMKLNCSIAGQIKGLLEVLNTIKKKSSTDFCYGKCTRLNLCLSRIKTLQNWLLIASQEKCMQNGGHIHLSPKMLPWFCTVPSDARLDSRFWYRPGLMEARFVTGLPHEKQLYQILGIHSDNMENPSRCAELEKLGGYIALLFPMPISCLGCFHLAYPEGILLDQR